MYKLQILVVWYGLLPKIIYTKQCPIEPWLAFKAAVDWEIYVSHVLHVNLVTISLNYT
jgi:hypothetical protein